MDRKYWLDLFTGKTWEEFHKSGGNVSGFKERRRNIAKKIRQGDYLICYLTGLSRFIGVLEVLSDSYFDAETRIWEDQLFPVRFKVKVIYALNAKTAIPVHDLKDKLSIFRDLKTPRAWSGFFRGSPVQFDQKDAEVIIEAIKDASTNPIERDFDERKYWRRPKIFESITVGKVTVPDEEEVVIEEPETEAIKTTHEEMQWLLLKLGSDMGLDVWVARNDRNKQYNGVSFQSIPKLRKELPRQFDEATNRTIELIDVLWLQKDAIMAAFEVEHTSSIYSGLLRMSDLISMQPNLRINLYIVAPDDRSDKVIGEVNRPTFARLNPPLPKICKFIPYSQLKKEVEQIGYRARYISPQFIDGIAESCEPDEA
jgi:predicted RNA-binding protein